MCSFEVGQEVVCVRDDWKSISGSILTSTPIAKNIYRITGIEMGSVLLARYFPGWQCIGDDPVYLSLAEYGPNSWWESSYFRLAKKTDISELRALLVPIKSKQKEDA